MWQKYYSWLGTHLVQTFLFHKRDLFETTLTKEKGNNRKKNLIDSYWIIICINLTYLNVYKGKWRKIKHFNDSLFCYKCLLIQSYMFRILLFDVICLFFLYTSEIEYIYIVKWNCSENGENEMQNATKEVLRVSHIASYLLLISLSHISNLRRCTQKGSQKRYLGSKQPKNLFPCGENSKKILRKIFDFP